MIMNCDICSQIGECLLSASNMRKDVSDTQVAWANLGLQAAIVTAYTLFATRSCWQQINKPESVDETPE